MERKARRGPARLPLYFAIGLVNALGLSAASIPAFSASYDELKAAAIKHCQAIDPSEYQTGLIFNPDGYRTYYVRSECFQRTAIDFRDETLCVHVRQRHSMFLSSWGYSETQCRKLATEGIAADRKALEEVKALYIKSPITLRDFRVERNGNGRDFDIIPTFAGNYAHSYVLGLEIVPFNASDPPLLVHSMTYYVDGSSNLRIFLRLDEVRKRIPDFAPGRLYTMRATLILDIGRGGLSGHWSEAFIERVFPLRERSPSISRGVRF